MKQELLKSLIAYQGHVNILLKLYSDDMQPYSEDPLSRCYLIDHSQEVGPLMKRYVAVVNLIKELE